MRANRRLEIASRYYVNKTEIKELLVIPRKEANELYGEVYRKQSERRFRPHPNKVPLKEVLALAGVDYRFLIKQIQIESEAR